MKKSYYLFNPGRMSRKDNTLKFIPVDADGNQGRLMGDDVAVAHAFVAGVEDQVGIGFVEFPMGKARQCFVQPLVGAADRAG